MFDKNMHLIFISQYYVDITGLAKGDKTLYNIKIHCWWCDDQVSQYETEINLATSIVQVWQHSSIQDQEW